MSYDDLEGWDGKSGREAQEGGDVCIHMTDHDAEPQKLTHCKAIIFQFLRSKKKKKKHC